MILLIYKLYITFAWMSEFVERSIWFPLLLSDLVFLALGTWIVITAPLNHGYIQHWIIVVSRCQPLTAFLPIQKKKRSGHNARLALWLCWCPLLNIHNLKSINRQCHWEAPGWASQFGLVRRGNYYEGYIDDLSSVLDIYQRDTISTWGTRWSSYTCDKENTPHEKVIHCILYFTID